MTLTFKEFAKLAKSGVVIPFIEEVVVDLETPLSAYIKLPKSSHKFLLESVEGGAKWGRYSMVGADPIAIFRSAGNVVEIIKEGKREKVTGVSDPLKELEKLMGGFNVVGGQRGPRFRGDDKKGGDDAGRFDGGAVGFLSYDMVRHFEKITKSEPGNEVPGTDFYDSYFIVPRLVLIFDNLSHVVKIVYNVHITNTGNLKSIYNKAVKDLARYVKIVIRGTRTYFHEIGTCPPNNKMKIEANLTKKDFEAAVEKVKEYIRAGDVIQTVISIRFETKGGHDPLSIYRALRRINPSPYMFIFEFGDHYLAGASPETMVRLEGDKLSLRPIAGTRPRGKNKAEDKKFEEELLEDPKEKAEHIMLVDLGRNDLGRVAEKGSVEVTDLMMVERYSHVMHIVSNVNAKLAKGKGPYDVLRATFPAGTLTGAPKVRAMEIIEELEPTRRGPYGGCAGYIGFSGNMDMAITIRACFGTKKFLCWQAGAGIVADSVPAREYEECVNKAKAVVKAIEVLEGGT